MSRLGGFPTKVDITLLCGSGVCCLLPIRATEPVALSHVVAKARSMPCYDHACTRITLTDLLRAPAALVAENIPSKCRYAHRPYVPLFSY